MEAAPEVKEPRVEEVAEPVAVARREGRPMAPHNGGALVVADDTADLLRLAVEKGTPVEQLTALVDLRERMEARQARREYFAALKAFQEEYAQNPVVKERKADIATRDGGEMKYKYANVDDVAQHIRPMLMKHDLSYKWNSKVEGALLTCTTIVMHVGGHSEASDFSVPTENKAGMSPQQKVGSAMSYAQARGLANALGITITDEAPDVSDPTPVSDEQLADIQAACEQHSVPVERLLRMFSVKAMGEVRRGDYMKVLQAIDDYAEAMAKRAAKKGGAQ